MELALTDCFASHSAFLVTFPFLGVTQWNVNSFKVSNITIIYIRKRTVFFLSLKFPELVKNFYLQCEPSLPCLCFIQSWFFVVQKQIPQQKTSFSYIVVCRAHSKFLHDCHFGFKIKTLSPDTTKPHYMLFWSPSMSFIVSWRNQYGITLRMSYANLHFCAGISKGLLRTVGLWMPG